MRDRLCAAKSLISSSSSLSVGYWWEKPSRFFMSLVVAAKVCVGGPTLISPLLSSCSLSSFSEWRAGTRRRRSRTTTYDVFYKSLATNRVPPPSIFSSFFFSFSFSSPHIKVVCVCMRVYWSARCCCCWWWWYALEWFLNLSVNCHMQHREREREREMQELACRVVTF